MARVNYSGIVTELVGNIGGSTFQKNGSGFIVRNVGHCRKSSSTAQRLQHQKHYATLNEYSNLILDNKLLWRSFASAHPRIDKFGTSKFISGANWFQSINSNLKLLDLSKLLVPPVYEMPVAVPIMALECRNNGLWWNITAGTGNTRDYLELYTSNVMLTSTGNVYRFLRSNYIALAQNPALIGITEDWELLHGSVYNYASFTGSQVIAYAGRTINSDSGIASPWVTGLSIVI